MGSGNPSRRLIVNADDFGRSHAINQAVVRAHREGILTTASLMVNGEAALEAIDLARQNPRLGVGLHLTLVCGRSTLSAKEIPGLVRATNSFTDSPVGAGLRYYFQPSLQSQLRAEMAAQFRKFADTGLILDHVNGHLNLHLHPAVFRILMENVRDWNVRRVRLTRDPFRLDVRLARGRWFYRLSHAVIFNLLSRRAEHALRTNQVRHTRFVFGLLQTGFVSEAYVLRLLAALPAGDSELYSHPCLDKFKHEADALVSPRVRAFVQEAAIQLIRYQDL